ncbi:MAG: hypothetical protein BWY63_02107 [Chloroflexi bacterium ADurb.Bin360]|nr:MAG: hypothetical protein BWY63_02107 [Chloroflexi bacterium ADurb.Bin360]
MRVGRLSGDAGELERAGVADRRVEIGALHVDGLRGGDLVEVGAGGGAVFREFGFVVAPALDPDLGTLARVGVLPQRREHLRDGMHEGHGAGDRIHGEGDVGGVRVRVNEAREHERTGQVVDRSTGWYLGCSSNPGEAPLFDGEGAGEAGFIDAGKDFRVAIIVWWHGQTLLWLWLRVYHERGASATVREIFGRRLTQINADGEGRI